MKRLSGCIIQCGNRNRIYRIFCLSYMVTNVTDWNTGKLGKIKVGDGLLTKKPVFMRFM